MNRIMAFCGALLCLVMSACRLPPFDEDLSLAVATASKLESVIQIGPIKAWHGDFEGGEMIFMPSQDAPDSTLGFLLIASDYYLRIRYVDGTTSQLVGEIRFDGPAGDPNRKTYTAVSLKTGLALAPPYLSLAVFDPASASNNSLLVLESAFAAGTSMNLFGALNGAFPVTPLDRVVGAHLYPQVDPALDRFCFLAVLDTPGHFGEVEAEANYASAGGIGAITPVGAAGREDMYLPSLPTPGSGAFYYHRPVNPYTSYLSSFDASKGTYKNYVWDDTHTAHQLTGMSRRIDALLTSGELLSFTSGICYVYNGSGSRKYAFPMGNLRFCFEKYDLATGKYRLYFSLVYWIYGYRDSEDKLYINVYSIPTASLESLD
jgi:hypothetical protein